MDNFNIFLLSNGILSSNIIAWWSTTDKKVWKWIILAGIVKFSKKISFFEGVGWGLLQIPEGGRVFETIVEPTGENREHKFCNRGRFSEVNDLKWKCTVFHLYTTIIWQAMS